ncbi:MAG: glycosyltransferase family 1 protein [Actinomycetota bacterium]|nr:glycosyltransferase family 1 protein [Actinomycetota bacterium]
MRSLRVAYTLEQCWHRVPGGTARAAIDAGRAIDAGPDVELVGVAARHRDEPDEAYSPPVAVHHLPLPRLALYESWRRLRWPSVQRATGPVDVIHATGYAVPPRSAPLVVTFHDLAFVHDPTQFTRRGVSFLRACVAAARARADLVLCSSEATLTDCIAEGFAPERLRVVPLGVGGDDVAEDAVAAARARHGLDGRYVVWVGTAEPRKNLPRLLDAFAALDRDDVRLALVGPPGWGPDLSERIGALGDRVVVCGFVPAVERDALLAGAEVLCYPSLREGFGLPVLEAMRHGTPVVTSTGTSTEEVAAGAGELVDPRDTAAITAALARVLDDEAHAAALADAGRRRAAEHTWERTASLTVAAYREVAG